jgi:hypothetical protein
MAADPTNGYFLPCPRHHFLGVLVVLLMAVHELYGAERHRPDPRSFTAHEAKMLMQ